MMFFLEAAQDIQDSNIMLSLVRTILLDICAIIYKLIIYVYELFIAIGGAQILTSDQVQVVYNRVGLILGIIMIFRLIFTFVQYMLDPDKITDKEQGIGGVIKKVLVVILALGLTDWVFDKAFELQDKILQQNVIGKIVLGSASSSDEASMENFGTLFSYSLFNNFYRLSNYAEPDVKSDPACGTAFFGTENEAGELQKYIATYKDYEITHKCVNKLGEPGGYLNGNNVYVVTFNGLEALVVGGITLWVLLMYTITLAIRVVKLAFLRIIAPIPILSNLAPKKDTAFQKWVKQCITTFLDLFIRLAIIYFCMLLISVILGGDNELTITSSGIRPDEGLYMWFKLLLVLGILLFAKKVPDILGEIFPSMGGKGGLDFGLGLKSRTDFLGKGALGRVAGAGLGMGAIGLLGGIQGFNRRYRDKDGNVVYPHGKERAGLTAAGVAGGMFRGLRTGAKKGNIYDNLKTGLTQQAKVGTNTFKYDMASRGGTSWDRLTAGIAKKAGITTKAADFAAEREKYERAEKDLDLLNGYAKMFNDGTDSNKSRSIDRIAHKQENTQLVGADGKMKNIYQEQAKKIGNLTNGGRTFEFGGVAVDLTPEMTAQQLYKTFMDTKEGYQVEINSLTQKWQTATSPGERDRLKAEIDTKVAMKNNIDEELLGKKLYELNTIGNIIGETGTDQVQKDAMLHQISNAGKMIETITTMAQHDIHLSENPTIKATMQSEYETGKTTCKIMLDGIKQIKENPANYQSVIDSVNSQLSALEIPDFNSVRGEDGKFIHQKEIHIGTTYDLLDQLDNYIKAINKSASVDKSDVHTLAVDFEQSDKVMNAKAGEDNPWFND